MPNSPRILLLDIETQPDLVWVWRMYDANAIEVAEHWKILSFSAEWIGGGKVTKGLDDYPGYTPKKDDRKLVAELWEMLNVADIVVAHNAASFDVKKVNARFILHGFEPPAPYRVVDTKRDLKRIAAFSSNKLDWLAKELKLGSKMPHEGFPLWLGCMRGDQAAWKRMKRYNRHDVVLLKKLYKRLAPWITQPNMALWKGGICCPNPLCGSKQIQWRGTQRNRTRSYRRFQCQVCGKWGRATTMIKTERAESVGVQ
jgi:hypothetical protein